MNKNRNYYLGLVLALLFFSCGKKTDPVPNSGTDSTKYIDTTLRYTRKMNGKHHWIGTHWSSDGTHNGLSDTTIYLDFDDSISVLNDSTIYFKQGSTPGVYTLFALSWDTMTKRIIYTSAYHSDVSYEHVFDTVVYNYGAGNLIYSEYFTYKGHEIKQNLHSP